MAKKKVSKKKVGVSRRRRGGGAASAKAAAEVSGGVPGGLELAWVAAGELEGHPGNWRRHPASQRAAFRSLLEEVGWCGYVVYNRTTRRILDGHMRVESVPASTVVPVLMGAWSEEQERLILATYNPIGASAGVDAAKGRALLEEVEAALPGVQAVLEGLERTVAKMEREMAKAQRQAEDGGGGKDDADEEKEARPKPLKAVREVMVRCEDELDQMALLKRLQAAGFKVRRSECL